jgi:hypothetical protein
MEVKSTGTVGDGYKSHNRAVLYSITNNENYFYQDNSHMLDNVDIK